jgi:AcrR family transcriptional regulator
MASRKPGVRDRILGAASRLFYRRGIRCVGVDAIATEAGSNKMSLYRHFRSKEQLAAEYLRTQIREAWKHWDATTVPFQGNPRRQLEALLSAHLAKDKACRGSALANVAIMIADDGHILAALVREFKVEMRERLRKIAHELGARDPGVLSDALLLLMEGSDFTSLVFRGNTGPTTSLMLAANALIDSQLGEDVNSEAGIARCSLTAPPCCLDKYYVRT